jgi:hypothetical protein
MNDEHDKKKTIKNIPMLVPKWSQKLMIAISEDVALMDEFGSTPMTT